ncbi:hypothetical protein Acsp03_58680 [Actinomadura sp. NBRC 104412]|nr:hypothetical protein Acsp03_58680 [Actinomadura sp. NBRC 104412]
MTSSMPDVPAVSGTRRMKSGGLVPRLARFEYSGATTAGKPRTKAEARSSGNPIKDSLEDRILGTVA